MRLTQKQRKKIEMWDNFVSSLPKFSKPHKLIEILAKLLPDRCIFHREIYYNGVLILYIPSLCGLNPWFDAIVEEKLNGTT